MRGASVVGLACLCACGRSGFEARHDAAVDVAVDGAPDAPALDPSLVAWWKLDETAGTSAIDSSGNGETGTLVGSPTWVPNGKIGGALLLTGSQYVLVPTNGAQRVFQITGTHPLTVAAWVYANSSTSSTSAMYRGVIGETDYTNSWLISGGDNADSIGFFINSTRTSTSTMPVPLSTWLHVAATFDGTNVAIYFNGAQITTSTVTATITPGDIEIGGNPAGTSWDGMLDDVRVYDRVLTATELGQLAAM